MSAYNTPKNNFDLVRLGLALTVCLVHASTLSGAPDLVVIGDLLSSEFAVQGFFAVSGYLIFMSYERSSTLYSYFEKRARRLIPGYVIVILMSAIGLGLVSTTPDFYFTRGWWAYLAANLSYLNFLHPDLPGVFEGNVNHAVNGALWTLKVEIGFYLIVPLIVWAIRRAGPWIVITALYLLSSLYAAKVGGSLNNQLPGELRYFMAGTACYYGESSLRRFPAWITAAAIAVFVAGHSIPLGLVMPLAVGVMVMCAGLFCYLGNFGRYGDFSYGVYIIHFPIIQLMIQAGAFEVDAWGALAASITMALAGAVTLWHLVERRFLKRHNAGPAGLEEVQPAAT